MQAELQAPVALLYSFLLVVARIGGAFIFVPLPGIKSVPDPARVVLVMAISIALFPVWPHLAHDPSILEYAGLLVVEAGFGLCIGLLAGFLSDAALLFGQIVGLHAGYSFASTVDPDTQADSPVMSSIAQALSGLLFVTMGLHLYVIRLFARSLETQPPGQLVLNARWSEAIIHAGGTLFSVGFRLSLPVLALLLMVDVTLSLLGRIHVNLQIMQFATPLKCLAALALVGVLLRVFMTVYSEYATHLFGIAAGLIR